MISIQKNTVLADAYKMHRYASTKSVVKVGGIGMQKPTLVGNAVKFFKSDSHVRVGAEQIPTTTNPKEHEIVEHAPASESRQLAHKVVDTMGKTAGIFISGSMVFGPPVIGGLLWGGTGLMIGSFIASPFVLVFVWSLFA